MMRCIKTEEGRGGTICKIEPSLHKEAVQIFILPSRSCLYQASENFVDLDAAHHRSSNTGGLCFPCSWFKCVGECSEMSDHCQAPSVILMTTKEHKATCLWSPLQGLWCQALTRATRDRLAGGDGKHTDFLFLIAALESIPSDSEKAQRYSFFFLTPRWAQRHFLKVPFQMDFLKTMQRRYHTKMRLLYGLRICDITDKLKMAAASSLYWPHSKPNYSDFNHTVYKWLTL